MSKNLGILGVIQKMSKTLGMLGVIPKMSKNLGMVAEIQTKKHAENILKMDKFHNIKCKAYPHSRLNTSKGIIGSWELSLATPEEIEMALQK